MLSGWGKIVEIGGSNPDIRISSYPEPRLTFWRYLICLAFEATWASSVAFFLDRTSEVTMPQDRHIFLPDLTSSILPDLYIHESDCENYKGAMGKFV